MEQSFKGRKATQIAEGLHLTAYKCPAGRWTIGYGHTGPDVKPGMSITITQAEALYNSDIAKAGRDVARLVKRPLTQGQYDALVDFAFNVGGSKLATSTLLKMINAGFPVGDICAQFRAWVYGDGSKNGKDDDGDGIIDEPGEKQKLPGLVKRREMEVGFWMGI